jgi:hypothetical protein
MIIKKYIQFEENICTKKRYKIFNEPLNVKNQNELNPCEHRATIVAQAYLKSFKKCRKRDRRIVYFKYIMKNFDLVPKK